MKKKIFFVAAASMAVAAHATEYRKPHDLMVDAIQNGTAEGVMLGDVADTFSETFHSNGALLVSARTVRQLGPNCRRLEVTFRKQGVATPKGLTDAILKSELNYCLDGSAPVTLE